MSELWRANPVRAAADGTLLPLILCPSSFAAAAAALPDEKRHTLTQLADVTTQALIRIVRWVLVLAPLGVFALVAGAGAPVGLGPGLAMALFVFAGDAGAPPVFALVLPPAVAVVAP